jgi:SNF2-related domain
MFPADVLPKRTPEVGELIHVRARRWLVEQVTVANRTSAIVHLACADDDAQGEELDVLWDYEPDRRSLDEERWDHVAARGFDDPRHFAAFLNTLRWNTVTATDANLFQSPFRAGITIDAYQMEPLRKALRLPRVNLFIADDTGLGKTIEAGLIARELLLRKKAKTIVVAAPPSVLEQWKAELDQRFGLDPHRVVRELLVHARARPCRSMLQWPGPALSGSTCAGVASFRSRSPEPDSFGERRRKDRTALGRDGDDLLARGPVDGEGESDGSER